MAVLHCNKSRWQQGHFFSQSVHSQVPPRVIRIVTCRHSQSRTASRIHRSRMSDQPDEFTVFATGAMNPRIHHPAWYKSMGILSSEDADAAAHEPGLVCLDQLARFKAGDIAIQCEQGRWFASTNQAELLHKLVDIVVGVFDNGLPHTPIGAFGLAFAYHSATGCAHVGTLLAEHLRKCGLELEISPQTQGFLALFTEQLGRQVHLRVEPSMQGPDRLFVGFTATYVVTTEPSAAFELGPRIRARVDLDRDESLSQRNRILEVLTSISN